MAGYRHLDGIGFLINRHVLLALCIVLRYNV